MLNNIDPTAPSGGLPSEVKHAFKPEVGFEFFYKQAEVTYHEVLQTPGMPVKMEAQIALASMPDMVHYAYGDMLATSVNNKSHTTSQLVRLTAMLLSVHLLNHGNTQDFFKQLLGMKPLASETEDERIQIGRLIMNDDRVDRTPLEYTNFCLSMFVKADRFPNFFEDVRIQVEAAAADAQDGIDARKEDV